MSNERGELQRHPEYGYWFFAPPSEHVLKEHYEKRYFQTNEIYSSDYSREEVDFHRETAKRKVRLVRAHTRASPLRCLELGVGEGWSMAALRDAGILVEGIDYSAHGISRWNPALLDAFTACEPMGELSRRISVGERYDLIWLDNVLEHVPGPELTMSLLASALRPGGLALIEVPNDESDLQHFLLKEGMVPAPYWLSYPEHLSYFSLQSLTALARASELVRLDAMADFPIDLFLFNDLSNYARDRSAGKPAHLGRLRFESFLASLSAEIVTDFYRGLASAGLGRNITALFRKL